MADSSQAKTSGVSSKSAGAKKRAGRWLRRLVVALPLAVGVYALVGFFVVPWAAQRWGVPMVSEMLNGEAAVDVIRTNPFALSLTLEGVRVTDEQGRKVVALERLQGNLQASSLFREGFVLREVVLDRPYVLAELREDGSLNLATLVKPSAEPSTEPLVLPRVRGEGVSVLDAKVEFIDRMVSGAPDRVIEPVTFELGAFDTLATHRNAYQVALASDVTEAISLEGSLFLNPFDLEGTLTVQGFDLPSYVAYAELALPVSLAVAGGKVDVSASYVLAPAATPKRASVTLDSVQVTGLDASLAAHPLIEARRLGVERVTADAVARSIVVGLAGGEGVSVRLERDAEGRLGLVDALGALGGGTQQSVGAGAGEVALLSESLADAVPAPYDEALRSLIVLANDSVKPWTIRVEEVSVSETTAEWSDATTDPPVSLAVEGTTVTAGPLTSEEGFATDFALSTSVVSGGSVSVSGRVEPMSGSVLLEELEVVGLGLVAVGPYVSQADGRLALSAGALEVRGSGLSAALVEGAAVPALSLGSLSVTGSMDATVSGFGPPLDVPVRDLSIALSGMDTAAGEAATLAFSTGIYQGTVAVDGTVLPDLADPLNSSVDLTVVIDKLGLPAVSPVSGEFVGRKIAEGELATPDSKPLTISLLGKQLESLVPVKIMGFDFGDKVASENATNLPVGLAVALLKDGDGTISPPPIKISGDLSDPSVSVGGVVVYAVTQMVTNVATSPFKMLGGMLGGGSEDGGEEVDLSYVAFEPGSAELGDAAKGKLDRLGEALSRRPGLGMAVAGVATPGLDRPAMRRMAFVEALQKRTAETLGADDPRRADPSLIAVTDEQYRDAIRFAYAEMQLPAGGPDSGAGVMPQAEPAKQELSLKDGTDESAVTEESVTEETVADSAEAVEARVAEEGVGGFAEEAGVMSVEEAFVAEEDAGDSTEGALSLPVLDTADGDGLDDPRENPAQRWVRVDDSHQLRAGRRIQRFTFRRVPEAIEPPEAEAKVEAKTDSEAVPASGATNAAATARSDSGEVSEAEVVAGREEAAVVGSGTAVDGAEMSDEGSEAEPVVASLEAAGGEGEGVATAGAGEDADSAAEADRAEVTMAAEATAELSVPFEEAEAEAAVLARLKPSAEALSALRDRRVRSVVDYLVGPAGLPSTRVVGKSEAAAPTDPPPGSPRVVFEPLAE